jgi:hypothetical protein
MQRSGALQSTILVLRIWFPSSRRGPGLSFLFFTYSMQSTPYIRLMLSSKCTLILFYVNVPCVGELIITTGLRERGVFLSLSSLLPVSCIDITTLLTSAINTTLLALVTTRFPPVINATSKKVCKFDQLLRYPSRYSDWN